MLVSAVGPDSIFDSTHTAPKLGEFGRLRIPGDRKATALRVPANQTMGGMATLPLGFPRRLT